MLHATVREWKDLYQTIYHCLLLGELTSCQPGSIDIFKDVRIMNFYIDICKYDDRYITGQIIVKKQIATACKSEVLRSMSQEMMRVVDFEESLQKGRFVARHGIDPELDKSNFEYHPA